MVEVSKGARAIEVRLLGKLGGRYGRYLPLSSNIHTAVGLPERKDARQIAVSPANALSGVTRRGFRAT